MTLASILLWTTFATEPLRIAVAPIVNTAPCKFAGPDVEQTHAVMAQAGMEYLDRAMTATDIVFVDPMYVKATIEDQKLNFEKGSDRKPEKLQSFGKSLNANYALLIWVDWTEQKNADPGAIAYNPNTVKSSSKVRVRFWLQSITDNKLVVDGTKSSFIGEAKGGYFGTVNAREMSGPPDAIGLAQLNEYRKRAQYLARALVEALKLSVKPQLGLKDPDSLS